MDLFCGRKKVIVTHFKCWESEKIIVIIILVALIYRVVAVC